MSITTHRLKSSGERRKYLLYMPTNYQPDKPIPLVISLHGFSEWPAHQMRTSCWNEVAERNGFLVVYPSGTGFPRRWRVFDQAGETEESLRDIRFISELMDKLARDYPIDQRRVYVNGLSNGGGMAFVLACALSERITAMGSVAGAYSFPAEQCKPSRPVPMIFFHGTADPIVPYQGGQSARRFTFPSIPDWVKQAAEHNGCQPSPVEIPASGEVHGVKYTNCEQNAEVIFYTVNGGGHSWPGGKPLPRFIVGRTSQDINASQVMWDFFSQYTLEQADRTR